MNIHQKEMYLMLVEIDKISRKYNLSYYLSYGTLLGAIRHRGFIPWDSDIDIIVPIDEYEKFYSSLFNNLPPEYEILSHKSTSNYTELFSRVSLKNKSHFSIHVDIYQLAGTSNIKLIQGVISKFAYLNKMMFYMKQVNIKERFLDNKMKSNIARISKLVLFPFPLVLFIKIHYWLSSLYSYKSAKYIFNIDGSYGTQEVIPKSWLGIPQFRQFETTQFPVPEFWHEYLEHFYSDYMEPRKTDYLK